MAVDTYELMTEVVAEIGVMWDRTLRVNRKLLKANGKKIAALAEQHAVAAAPLVPGRGLIDLDLERHGVTLANRKLPDDEHQPWYRGHSVNPEHDGN